MREVSPTHGGGRNLPGSKPRAREGVKVVNLFDVKTVFDERQRETKARMKKSLDVPLEKPSQRTALDEISTVVFNGQEVLRSTVVGRHGDEKGPAINKRRQQSDAEVSDAIREGHEARTARSSESAIFDAPTNYDKDGKSTPSDVSEGENIAKDRSYLARETDVLVFRRARSAQVTIELMSVSKVV